MLRPLRWKLTLAFLLATLTLILVIGGGVYQALHAYFINSVDLALQHRMAGQFQFYGAELPPELVQAEQEWLTSQAASTLAPPSDNFVPIAGSAEPEDDDFGGEGREDDEHESAENAGSASVNSGDSNESPGHELLEGAYTSELAIIFVLPLDQSGTLIFDPNPYGAPIDPDPQAAAVALQSGYDWRYERLDNGERIRLLTYRLQGVGNPAILQVGRLVSDQDRVLNQVIWGISTVGGMLMLLAGLGSWWLAGRSLVPAQKAWDQQQAFVANASHELRTPLTLIRASTEMAQRGPLKEKEHDLLQDVLDESDYMSRLVNDLLLLSRLDSGRLQLEREEVDIGALVDEVVTQMVKLSQAHTLEVVLPDGLPTVNGDRARLRQVLLILIDNALKYTPPGSHIRVGGRAGHKGLDLWVADDGPGIPTADLKHIFDRFYQAGKDARQNGHSNGLGLSIARGLIELHGGVIEAHSQPGQGTEIRIHLPRAA